MSLAYIRDTYKVPAKRGARVEYTWPKPARMGTIISGRGAKLRIRLDGDSHTGLYHPTWELRYLAAPTAQQEPKP